MNPLTQRFVQFLDRAEETFMAVSLAFMTILTFIQVMMREFGAGWVWSLEATTYAFAWMILIGMSYGVRTQAHIAIDLVSNKLPPKARRIMALTAVALCLLYCGFMFYGGSLFVNGLMTLGNNARDIPLPRWSLTIIMPIAFVLLTFRFVQVGIRVWSGELYSLGHTTRDSKSRDTAVR
ncbi:MAG: TRAP transporter small permease [Candidatus Rariloculaceae bacterium]